MSENNISKTTLFYIKALAYICLVNFLINEKTKIFVKIVKLKVIFLLCSAWWAAFSFVTGRGLRTTALNGHHHTNLAFC